MQLCLCKDNANYLFHQEKHKKILFLFCISLNLDKNLTLRKEKIFSFPSLNRFFALSLHSDFGRSVDLSPSFGKIIKRLLIIRMFEKLSGGKNRQIRIIVNVHVMRGRFATSICLGFRQVPSNGDVTSSTFFFVCRCLSGIFSFIWRRINN